MIAISSTDRRAQTVDKSGAAASRANGPASSAGTARPAPCAEVAESSGGMITLRDYGCKATAAVRASRLGGKSIAQATIRTNRLVGFGDRVRRLGDWRLLGTRQGRRLARCSACQSG